MLAKPPHKRYSLFSGLSCLDCSLEQKGRGFSLPKGDCSNGVLLVGEALGEREADRGQPFLGAAGYMLHKVLKLGRHDPGDFGYWNIIACQPPGNWLDGAPWEQPAAAHCRQYLERVVGEFEPKALCLLGGVPLRHILGETGLLHRREPKRGYTYNTRIAGRDLLVVPSIHPSYLMRGNQHLMGVLKHDIDKAVRLAQHSEPDYNPYYILQPTRSDIQQFIASARGKWLTADIETSMSHKLPEDEYDDIEYDEIVRISFAAEPGHSITIPWQPSFIPLIQELLLLPNQSSNHLIFWNAPFDGPRLQSAGLQLADKVLDAMMMWHFLQPALPKALGFVTPFFAPLREWKSQSDSRPAFYSCCDADAQITNAEGCKAVLQGQGRLDRFMRHHVQLQPILTEIGQRGIPIDPAKRDAFKQKIEEAKREQNQTLQEHIPVEVMPKEERKVLRQELPCWRCLGTGCEVDRKASKVSLKQLEAGELPEEVQWTEEVCKKCDGSKVVTKNVTAEGQQSLDGWAAVERSEGWVWQRDADFLPGSPQQVLRYVEHKGHKLPRFKGKSSTDEKALASLAKRYKNDPVYPLILEVRKAQKMLSQYIEGYQPDADGKIRTWLTQYPSTGRLASQKPNLHNVPKRGPLAKEFRKMFVAEPGCVLVEVDFSAIEAVLVGWFAQDEEYIRAAKLSIHAGLASHLLYQQGKLTEPIDFAAWSDELIRRQVRLIKDEYGKQYDTCKRICHLSNYLGTPLRIKHEYPEDFPTVAAAEQLQFLYFRTIGKKIRPWHQRVLEEAERNHYLENPFGYRLQFWDVLGTSGYGTQAKDAIAFLPQSTAAAIIKEAILRIAEKPFYREAMRLQIHDSLLFSMPNDNLLLDRIEWVQQEMQRPVPELGGLSIGTEASWGKNWGEMTSA